MINRELSNRINTVQSLFPEWINWKYIRDLFLMPNGMKPEGVKQAGYEYNKNRNKYPFHCYINRRVGRKRRQHGSDCHRLQRHTDLGAGR